MEKFASSRETFQVQLDFLGETKGANNISSSVYLGESG